MIFSEKLQLLRKNKGYTQEEFAERLNVSRQAVAKWESGQAYPDISNLIQISNMMNETDSTRLDSHDFQFLATHSVVIFLKKFFETPTTTCHTADRNTISPASICINAKYPATLAGFKDMRKFIIMMRKYMNAIFMED